MIADRVSGRMPARPLIARETVIGDTPTFAATSLIVARRARRPAVLNYVLPPASGRPARCFGNGRKPLCRPNIRGQLAKKGPGARPGQGVDANCESLVPPS